jgi:hypothetical protein
VPALPALATTALGDRRSQRWKVIMAGEAGRTFERFGETKSSWLREAEPDFVSA